MGGGVCVEKTTIIMTWCNCNHIYEYIGKREYSISCVPTSVLSSGCPDCKIKGARGLCEMHKSTKTSRSRHLRQMYI